MLWGLLHLLFGCYGLTRFVTRPTRRAVLLLGLGVAALRLGLTGADTGFLAGLFLLRLQDILHSLPLRCLQRLLTINAKRSA